MCPNYYQQYQVCTGLLCSLRLFALASLLPCFHRFVFRTAYTTVSTLFLSHWLSLWLTSSLRLHCMHFVVKEVVVTGTQRLKRARVRPTHLYTRCYTCSSLTFLFCSVHTSSTAMAIQQHTCIVTRTCTISTTLVPNLIHCRMQTALYSLVNATKYFTLIVSWVRFGTTFGRLYYRLVTIIIPSKFYLCNILPVRLVCHFQVQITKHK